MGELHNAKPKRDLCVGVGAGRNEFDGCFLGLRFGERRKEYRGVVRAAQVVAQAETVVNNLTFALSPEIAHSAPPSANSHELANGGTPTSRGARPREKKRASKAGLERLDVRFACAGAR